MEETEGQLVFYLLCGYAALCQLHSQLGLLHFTECFKICTMASSAGESSYVHCVSVS